MLRNSGYTRQAGGDAQLQASISHSRDLKISLMLAEDAAAAKILHINDDPGIRLSDCQLFSFARLGKKYRALDPGLFLKASLTGHSGTHVELSQTTSPHYDGVDSAIHHSLENLPPPQWEACTTSHDSTRAQSSIPPQNIFKT